VHIAVTDLVDLVDQVGVEDADDRSFVGCPMTMGREW
jgi:hypothetical protein